MVKRYIGTLGVSEICHIAQSTVRNYYRFRLLPEPDVLVDAKPGWEPSRIQEWHASRPSPNKRPPPRNPRRVP